MASTAGDTLEDTVTDAAAAAPSLEEPVALAHPLRFGAAGASLGAAVVHASAIAEHTFHPLHAAAFVAMTTFQAWWAYLILRSSAARVLVIGALGHGAIVLLWLATRTVGLPAWVPGTHATEPVQTKDFIAVVLAVGALVVIDLLSRPDLRSRLVRPSRAGAVVGATFVAVLGLAVVGSFVTGHVHDDRHDTPSGTHPHS